MAELPTAEQESELGLLGEMIMAYKAEDGQEFTNRYPMVAHNSSLKARGKSMPTDMGGGDQEPQSIVDDPKAMRLVDELQQMGYTGEDVEQAMGGGEMQPKSAQMGLPSSGGKEPISLPGI
jgi:hypothetical protein